MYDINMSIVMDILEDLWNIKLNYKGVPTRAFFIPDLWSENKNSYRATLSRLHKIKLIDKKNGYWEITNLGEKYLKEAKEQKNFDSPFEKNAPKNLLVIFDVPESKQNERKWLRKHLIKFDYFMIQKSVWVGPSPLPPKFVSYLKEIKLDICIKTFKLSNPYQIKKQHLA